MNQATYQSGHRSGRAGGEHYLESSVQTAPPARLRLMLIERGAEVARTLARSWRSDEKLGSNEWSLRLLDILNELLSGITGGSSTQEREVCLKVADLYVFLTQHLVAAEETSDADAIDEIVTLLEIEAETWRAVCAQSLAPSNPGLRTSDGESGLNLQA